MNAPPERPFTVKRLAERWDCSEEQIHGLTNEGRLRSFRIGIGPRTVRIPADAVIAGDQQGLALAAREWRSPRIPPKARRPAVLIDRARRAIEQAGAVTGEVYFARCERFVKIGYSASAKYRVAALQYGCPAPVTWLGSVPGSCAAEKALHRVFRTYHHRHEWFRLTPKLLSQIVDLCASYAREVADV